MLEIDLPLGYEPRPYQSDAHMGRRRWTVLVWHRRAGKTVWAVMELLDGALSLAAEGVQRPRFAYIAPLYRQAKTTAWDLLKSYVYKIRGADVNESELRVDLPGGARIQLFGADRPDTLRGMYLDGVVMDEVAQMDPKVWSEVIRPALSDRKGWAVWIGTPKGRNAFWEIYDGHRRKMLAGDAEYYADLKTVASTGALDEGELASARSQMAPEEYEQEYECSFQAAILGAYFGKEMAEADKQGRICRVPIDKGIRCVTAWDLGIGDSTAIWVAQLAGREIRLVDYIESSGVGLEHYARELDRTGYLFSEHLLPHDAEAKEMGTGRTRTETLRSLNVKPTRIVPLHSVDDGINAVRRILSRCWFDQDRCARGIEALRQYRRDWDEERKVFRPRPLHDWCSHPADAFRYLAMGMREKSPANSDRRYVPPPSPWAA